MITAGTAHASGLFVLGMFALWSTYSVLGAEPAIRNGSLAGTKCQ